MDKIHVVVHDDPGFRSVFHRSGFHRETYVSAKVTLAGVGISFVELPRRQFYPHQLSSVSLFFAGGSQDRNDWPESLSVLLKKVVLPVRSFFQGSVRGRHAQPRLFVLNAFGADLFRTSESVF
jgi:hypothetical protein